MPQWNFFWTMQGISLAAMLLASASVLIWFLRRFKRRRLRLPILRVLDLNYKKLPKLVVRIPPLLAFICFLMAAIMVVATSFNPKVIQYLNENKKQISTHLIIDMSPSMDLHIDLTEYANRIGKWCRSQVALGTLTYSTTHEASVNRIEGVQGCDVLITDVQSLGFHRHGTRLGLFMKDIETQLPEIDRLLIFSDANSYSWADFNWQYFRAELDMQSIILSEPKSIPNLYIQNVERLNQQVIQGRNPTFNLIYRVTDPVTDSFTGTTRDLKFDDGDSKTPHINLPGKLRVKLNSQLLSEQDILITSVTGQMVVTIDRESIQRAMKAQASSKDPVNLSLPHRLEWEMDVSDAMEHDNKFFAEFRDMQRQVTLISEPLGERPFDDPAHELRVALESLGYEIRRYDTVDAVQGGQSPKKPGPQWSAQELISQNILSSELTVMLGGGTLHVNDFCAQKPFSDSTLLGTATSDQMSPVRSRNLWLAPISLSADYRALCRCYVLLTKVRQATDFCSNVQSRAAWVELLPSLGANQIGGKVGSGKDALAWITKIPTPSIGQKRSNSNKVTLVSFTIPLRPSQQLGLTHGRFPLLMNEMLKITGLSSVSDVDESDHKQKKTAVLAQFQNIPVGESLYHKVSAEMLPPDEHTSEQYISQNGAILEKHEEAKPWLYIALSVIFGFMTLEVLGVFFLRRKNIVGRFSILALLVWWPTSDSFAQVEMVRYGKSLQREYYTQIAKEVAQRTSLELAEAAKVHGALNQQTLSEPWLWSSDISGLLQENGMFLPEISLWLQKGGFLILEGQSQNRQNLSQTLQKMTDALTRVSNDSRVGWSAVPTDHELMRSFYLLTSLPACKNASLWQAFSYDGRLAVLYIPFAFSQLISDQPSHTASACALQGLQHREQAIRTFVNLLMVSLATDYKKDQIHLPEILKRLR